MKHTLIAGLAALLLAPLAALHAADTTVTASNTEPRRDTRGEILDAHGCLELFKGSHVYEDPVQVLPKTLFTGSFALADAKVFPSEDPIIPVIESCLLLFEKGDTLCLLYGAPDASFAAGKPFGISGLSQTSGNFSFSVKPQPQPGSYVFSYECGNRVPAKFLLALPSGSGSEAPHRRNRGSKPEKRDAYHSGNALMKGGYRR
ncbi:MAG: hypothetical protein NTW21_02640 [Verrucomicrobia bacterium]|nr:hypothetical protein [Verrucomicrobiota bacterium]